MHNDEQHVLPVFISKTWWSQTWSGPQLLTARLGNPCTPPVPFIVTTQMLLVSCCTSVNHAQLPRLLY